MQEKAKQEMLAQQQKQMSVAKELGDRYYKKLKETKLQFAPIIEWFEKAKMALEYASPVSLGMPPNELKELIDLLYSTCSNDVPLTYYQFAVLSNNLEVRTPLELQMSLDYYSKFMVEAHSYSSQWNEDTAKLREEVKNEFIAENQVKDAAINGAASGNGAFKVVKGEA